MNSQISKINAAKEALKFVENGMTVGLGTGSTAKIFIDLLGEKLGDAWERTAGRGISHFGPETNLLSKLEQLFKEYSETGGGESRLYLHNEEIAAKVAWGIMAI